MRASSTLKREDGTSVFSCRAASALRTRARRSATGSVDTLISSLSPRRLADAGDVPAEGQVAEADAAHAELAQVSAAASADLAAVPLPDCELQHRVHFDDGGTTGHAFLLPVLAPERHPELAQEHAGAVVRAGRRHDRDVQPLRLVDLGGVDLREDRVVLDSERVVPAPVERARRHAAEVAHARERDGDEAAG